MVTGNRYECCCGQYITRDGWMSDEDWDTAIDEFMDNHYCNWED